MKRWIAAILTVLLLAQALPLNALAAAGHVLSDEELAAAYALTGFGAGGAARNAAYHKGMTPNESWNAMQVSDWLDDMLSTNLFSVEEILSQASVKLVHLREIDPEGYRRFTDVSNYAGVPNYVQEMYREVESLREALRYQQDRIEEQAGLIAELGRQLKQAGDALYPSDRARLSAKIEAATRELKKARREVVKSADQWIIHINLLQEMLDPDYEGPGDEGRTAGLVGDWLEALSGYKAEPVSNAAPVARVNRSGSLMGRLSAKGSVLSNADSATVHVMTENDIGLVFYTLDDDGEKKLLEGVKVTVQDIRNPGADPETFTSDARGGVYPSSSLFIVDDDKTVQFKLDVDAEAMGYRSFGAEKVEMKLGAVRQEP